jgi:phosphate transport system protein
MPRETFQQELDELVADVIELGTEVASSLESAVEAMISHEARVVESELGVDARYKAREAQIERACIIMQARQAPVARDLRVLYSAQSVTNHLVRSGALIEHVCHAIFETAELDKDEDLEAVLTEMAKAARNIFNEGLGIFKDLDADRARDLQAKDDKVDLLYSEALNLIANPPEGHGGAQEWRMRAAQMVHYLERISDRGVAIGASTVFLVTGERIGAP